MTDADAVEVKLALGLPGLSRLAHDRAVKVLQRFADELAQEAARIEEGGRALGLPPEVTATIIDNAYGFLRQPGNVPPPRPRSKTTKTVMVGQAVSGVVAGAMLTLMHSMWQAAFCTAVGVTFCIATLWLIFGDHG
ncbi:hypothetical protein ACTXG5_25480 [Mycobacterium sp. Dal123C01]|uniref:hypothetical protein n=1 Tax=Mycobacterium sp. Dal123C01 TaxID=3457577 RepID=UPI00403E6DA8